MKNLSLSYSRQDTIQFLISDDVSLSWIGEFDSRKYKRIFTIIDKNVNRIWGRKIDEQLKKHNKEIFLYEVEPVEFSKSLEFYPVVVDYLEGHLCNRYDLVVAVGGGIIIDLVSFLASTYMRGLPFYAISTTLIGQVDAITAGKTCLNTKNAKNVLGTFYYPSVVYNNIHILKTNDPYYARQGYSEIFKYGLLVSNELLQKLHAFKENGSDAGLLDIIELAIKARGAIRKRDPLASNLGHTFGHAIEKMSNYKILHGDAISVGTVMALHFAMEVGLISMEKVNEIMTAMKKLKLNIYLEKNMDVDAFTECMMRDKKSAIDALHLVLIRDIEKPYEYEGEPFYVTTPKTVRDFLKKFTSNYEYRINDCAEFIKRNELTYDQGVL